MDVILFVLLIKSNANCLIRGNLVNKIIKEDGKTEFLGSLTAYIDETRTTISVFEIEMKVKVKSSNFKYLQGILLGCQTYNLPRMHYFNHFTAKLHWFDDNFFSEAQVKLFNIFVNRC
jgi:hypothetical protein